MITSNAKAQCGVWLIEQAIVECLTVHGDWMSRPDIARALDIESNYGGAHGGFLSGGICKSLTERGVLQTRGGGGPGQTTYYRVAQQGAVTDA
jgi:hypothetical protein